MTSLLKWYCWKSGDSVCSCVCAHVYVCVLVEHLSVLTWSSTQGLQLFIYSLSNYHSRGLTEWKSETFLCKQKCGSCYMLSAHSPRLTANTLDTYAKRCYVRRQCGAFWTVIQQHGAVHFALNLPFGDSLRVLHCRFLWISNSAQ